MRTKIAVNRIKPKYNGKNKKLITKDDRDYLEWLQNQNYKCFVCGGRNGIEYHHIKEYSTDKKNHKLLIPLCGIEHHRLGELSPHGNPKLWREAYSMREQEAIAEKMYREFKESI